MALRRRSLSGSALASLLVAGCCDLAAGKSPRVELEPYLNYSGGLRVTGLAKFVFNNETSADFAWRLSGADVRCAQSDTQLDPHACRFELREANSCSEPLGQPLWGTKFVSSDPWTATRYNVSADGHSNAAAEQVALGLRQQQVCRHVVVVTDADGVCVACGLVTSACFEFLGVCLYQWMRIMTGVCAVLAILNSAWLINKHFRLNRNASLRKYTIRILMMAPIYSLQAFLSLWFQVNEVNAELMEFFRKLYESIVIVAFLQFILLCMGGSEVVIRRIDGPRDEEEEDEDDSGDVAARREEMLHHSPPWNLLPCVPPWSSAQQMLRWCVLGTMTYVAAGLIVPFMMLIATVFFRHTVVFNWTMKCSKGLLGPTNGIALTSLIELAHAFLPDLEDLSPLSKFLSVKVVVFFTFWQGWVLKAFVYNDALVGFIDPDHRWTTQEQIADAIQHGLICIEMFGASIVHHWAFPASDWIIVKKMYQDRALTMQDEPTSVGTVKSNALQKRVQVINFCDIVQIARFGLAPTHFVRRPRGRCGDEDSEGSDTDSEVSDTDSEDDGGEVRAAE